MVTETYFTDYVQVTLEWYTLPTEVYSNTATLTVAVERDSSSELILYNLTNVIENGTAQVNVLYNVMYTVSSVVTQCGHNSTSVSKLSYGKD